MISPPSPRLGSMTWHLKMGWSRTATSRGDRKITCTCCTQSQATLQSVKPKTVLDQRQFSDRGVYKSSLCSSPKAKQNFAIEIISLSAHYDACMAARQKHSVSRGIIKSLCYTLSHLQETEGASAQTTYIQVQTFKHKTEQNAVVLSPKNMQSMLLLLFSMYVRTLQGLNYAGRKSKNIICRL